LTDFGKPPQISTLEIENMNIGTVREILNPTTPEPSGLAKNIGHDAWEGIPKEIRSKLSREETGKVHKAIREAVDNNIQPIQAVLMGVNP
jgi:hypothetical protein